MPGAERRTAGRMPGGMGDAEGEGKEKGPRFRFGGEGQNGEDGQHDALLDETKETNKLLKDILETVKEKRGNPKRGKDSPANEPDGDGQDFDSFQKTVNKMIDGGEAAEGASEAAEGVTEFLPELIEMALSLGALAAG